MPIITKNGIQYNVNPNVIGASELTVTTPEIEVVGKAPLFDSRQSTFNRNELIQDADKILGNTIGKVIEPITRIPGVTPVLRTLTPSNWVGTIRTGVAPWNKNNEGLDLSVLIEQLRMELNQVQNAYRSMLSDGYIDDEELATLLGMVNKVINDGYSLKSLATDQSDLRVISVIINSLEEEQKKMNKMQNGIEEIGRTVR